MSLNYPYWGIGADLVITTNGANYDALLRYEGTEIKRTNSGIMTLVDWARGIVGNNIVVEFGRGDFTLDDEFDVTGSRTVIRGQGMDVTELILDTGINKDVIDITASRYVNVKIHDLKLNGNSNTGDCINASIASGAVPESMGWWLQFWNVRCYNAGDKGMEIAMTTTPASPQCLFQNIRSYDNDGSPEIYFKNIYDSLYYGLWASSIQWDSNCSSSHISKVYIGGGGNTPTLIDGDNIIVDNIRSDNIGNGTNGLRVIGDNNYVKAFISNKQNTEAGQDSVYCSGDYNFLELVFADDNPPGSTWRYLVAEGAGSDYNLYHIVDPMNLYTTGTDNLVGAHSIATVLI